MWLGLLGYFVLLAMVVVAMMVTWYIIGTLFWVIRRIFGRHEAGITWEVYILHFARLYLGAALVAYCTTRVVAHAEAPSWLLTTIGGLFVWVWIASQYTDVDRGITQADQEGDLESLFYWKESQKIANTIFLVSVPAYVGMLYLSFLAANPVTMAVLYAVSWVQSLRFVGWIVTGIGALHMLRYLGAMGIGVVTLPIGAVATIVGLVQSWKEERLRRRYGAYVQEVLQKTDVSAAETGED